MVEFRSHAETRVRFPANANALWSCFFGPCWFHTEDLGWEIPLEKVRQPTQYSCLEQSAQGMAKSPKGLSEQHTYSFSTSYRDGFQVPEGPRGPSFRTVKLFAGLGRQVLQKLALRGRQKKRNNPEISGRYYQACHNSCIQRKNVVLTGHLGTEYRMSVFCKLLVSYKRQFGI